MINRSRFIDPSTSWIRVSPSQTWSFWRAQMSSKGTLDVGQILPRLQDCRSANQRQRPWRGTHREGGPAIWPRPVSPYGPARSQDCCESHSHELPFQKIILCLMARIICSTHCTGLAQIWQTSGHFHSLFRNVCSNHSCWRIFCRVFISYTVGFEPKSMSEQEHSTVCISSML